MSTATADTEAAMRASYDSNKAHNVAAMDAAGIPAPARRGFTTATSFHTRRIVKIEHHASTVPGSSHSGWWIVHTSYDGMPSVWTGDAWIVGPRGKASKVSG